ncbi:DUF2254 family protein [Caballeronia sp. CLC5]|nr:DUF2254 family protein [Caballeronia sp. CLC5]MCE4575816.1 DUF2254 domain-containing protein [Caballeronia sp. CLC5]
MAVGVEKDQQAIVVPDRTFLGVGRRNGFASAGSQALYSRRPLRTRRRRCAINDPGTAIDVIGRGVRILSRWDRRSELNEEPLQGCDQVFVPGLSLADLFDDFFGPLSRDAASMLEVGIRLQKSLALLARNWNTSFELAAVRHAALALKRAEIALDLEEDKIQLRRLALKVRAVE